MNAVRHRSKADQQGIKNKTEAGYFWVIGAVFRGVYYVRPGASADPEVELEKIESASPFFNHVLIEYEVEDLDAGRRASETAVKLWSSCQSRPGWLALDGPQFEEFKRTLVLIINLAAPLNREF